MPTYIHGFHFELWDLKFQQNCKLFSEQIELMIITYTESLVLWLHHYALAASKCQVDMHFKCIMYQSIMRNISTQRCLTKIVFCCVSCTETTQNTYKHVHECVRAAHRTAMTLYGAGAPAMSSLLWCTCVEPKVRWVVAVYKYTSLSLKYASLNIELWTPCSHHIPWHAGVYTWASEFP